MLSNDVRDSYPLKSRASNTNGTVLGSSVLDGRTSWNGVAPLPLERPRLTGVTRPRNPGQGYRRSNLWPFQGAIVEQVRTAMPVGSYSSVGTVETSIRSSRGGSTCSLLPRAAIVPPSTKGQLVAVDRILSYRRGYQMGTDLTRGVYETGRTLRRVEELMTDLLLCELLGTKPQFVFDAFKHLGLGDPGKVISVRRSVHETSLGETDVEAVVEVGRERVGFLIENKVRALLMPEQLGRYRRRGEDGQKRLLWERYYVAVFSPEGYRSYIPAEDARIGYVKRLDTRMTHFHQSVHGIATKEYPQLRMAWLEQAGYDSSIIHLPHALPARGDSLLMKMKMGTAELRVETRDPIGAERALNSLLPDGWRTTRAKGYAGVEIAVGVLDATQDFPLLEPHVRRFLDALRELHDFYHRYDVSETIEWNRGMRPSRSKSA
jgi:hypothetical protein